MLADPISPRNKTGNRGKKMQAILQSRRHRWAVLYLDGMSKPCTWNNPVQCAMADATSPINRRSNVTIAAHLFAYKQCGFTRSVALIVESSSSTAFNRAIKLKLKLALWIDALHLDRHFSVCRIPCNQIIVYEVSGLKRYWRICKFGTTRKGYGDITDYLRERPQSWRYLLFQCGTAGDGVCGFLSIHPQSFARHGAENPGCPAGKRFTLKPLIRLMSS